jgi:hypothetical protein
VRSDHLAPGSIIAKTVVVHTVSYFVLGILAFLLLDYSGLFAQAGISQYMRPTTDRIVMAGPLFQPVRGLLLGVILYFLREPFFQRPKGWLLLWATLVAVGILSPYGAAPGSIEGLIYTKLPLYFHVKGLPEVLIQTLLFSAVLFYWVNRPERKWLNWGLGVLFFLVLVGPTLGLLVT